MAANPAISCRSDEYQRWLSAFSILLVLVIIAPPLLYLWLRRHRSSILTGPDPNELTAEEMQWHATSSVFFQRYRPPFYWWEVLVLLRRLLMLACFVLASAYGSPAARAVALALLSSVIAFGQYYFAPQDTASATVTENTALVMLAVVSWLAASAIHQEGEEWPTQSAVYFGLALVGLLIVRDRYHRSVASFASGNASKRSSVRRLSGVSASGSARSVYDDDANKAEDEKAEDNAADRSNVALYSRAAHMPTSSVASAHTHDKAPQQDVVFRSNTWQEFHTNDGIPYYVNRHGEAAWEVPAMSNVTPDKGAAERELAEVPVEPDLVRRSSSEV